MGRSRPFQRESYRNPNGLRPESGSGSGSGTAGRRTLHPDTSGPPRQLVAERRSRERWARDLAWARENFPELDPGTVTVAIMRLRGWRRREPTTEEVREQLVALGHLPSEGDSP